MIRTDAATRAGDDRSSPPEPGSEFCETTAGVAADGSEVGRGGPDGEGGSRGNRSEEKEGRRQGGSTAKTPGMALVPAGVKFVVVVVGVEIGDQDKEAEEGKVASGGGCDRSGVPGAGVGVGVGPGPSQGPGE